MAKKKKIPKKTGRHYTNKKIVQSIEQNEWQSAFFRIGGMLANGILRKYSGYGDICFLTHAAFFPEKNDPFAPEKEPLDCFAIGFGLSYFRNGPLNFLPAEERERLTKNDKASWLLTCRETCDLNGLPWSEGENFETLKLRLNDFSKFNELKKPNPRITDRLKNDELCLYLVFSHYADEVLVEIVWKDIDKKVKRIEMLREHNLNHFGNIYGMALFHTRILRMLTEPEIKRDFGISEIIREILGKNDIRHYFIEDREDKYGRVVEFAIDFKELSKFSFLDETSLFFAKWFEIFCKASEAVKVHGKRTASGYVNDTKDNFLRILANEYPVMSMYSLMHEIGNLNRGYDKLDLVAKFAMLADKVMPDEHLRIRIKICEDNENNLWHMGFIPIFPIITEWNKVEDAKKDMSLDGIDFSNNILGMKNEDYRETLQFRTSVANTGDSKDIAKLANAFLSQDKKDTSRELTDNIMKRFNRFFKK